MPKTINDWLDLAHQFYPKDLGPWDAPYASTVEYHRRLETRRKALEDSPRWFAMLTGLRDKFPDCRVLDVSLSHPHRPFESAFCAELILPTPAPGEGKHSVRFAISFLGPCYTLKRYRVIYVKEEGHGYKKIADGGAEITVVEEPYAHAIVNAIASNFPGHELMPADIASALVPDVTAGEQSLGHATLADCFFSP